MNSLTDQQLLQEYTGRGSEGAFAELVRRHVDLVYSAALRMVSDPHLAEDVTQRTFATLAGNAGELGQRAALSGWLHRTAQNLAANTVRSEVRRRSRENEAATMNEMFATEPDTTWEHVAPHLDAALGELSELDQDALLLRYFERKSAREIAAILGTSEDAAQKRVNRAVDRLRDLFAKRGITVATSGLVVVISANAVQAAPAGLGALITGTTPVAMATAAKAVTVAAKGGATMKTVAALASLGPYFAMLGGAYVSSRAQADDTKSPRERRFIHRMFVARLISCILLVGLLLGVRKLEVADDSLAQDIFSATLLFVATVASTLFFDYCSRRQRQIQVEDGTWIEAEWSLPRSVTDQMPGLAGEQSPRKMELRTMWSMTIGLVLFALLCAQAPWKLHWIRSVAGLSVFALALLLSYHARRRRPRFQALWPGWIVCVPILMGLITLLEFNIRQFKAQSGLTVSNALAPGIVTAFNLVVVMLYATLIGILVWKRGGRFRARQAA